MARINANNRYSWIKDASKKEKILKLEKERAALLKEAAKEWHKSKPKASAKKTKKKAKTRKK
ncbi:MAG: hypothetical protein KatS3mg101_1158 [Patescibacteria group bacterium]|nr:MAG: hypothetical protein KatS3mg101_1158 [Patescibacteria group bacterium]